MPFEAGPSESALGQVLLRELYDRSYNCRSSNARVDGGFVADGRTPERRATTKAQSPAGKSGGGASTAAAPASGTSLRQQISMRIRNSPAAKLVSKAATPISTSGLRRGLCPRRAVHIDFLNAQRPISCFPHACTVCGLLQPCPWPPAHRRRPPRGVRCSPRRHRSRAAMYVLSSGRAGEQGGRAGRRDWASKAGERGI